jgi:hypothetical protein
MFMRIKLTGFLGESRRGYNSSKGKQGEEFHKGDPVEWGKKN